LATKKNWSLKISYLSFGYQNNLDTVPHLAKLDHISKQCVYQGSQVSSLGRISLTCTGFNLYI